MNHEVKLRVDQARSFVSCVRSSCLRLSDSVKNVRCSETTSVFQHTPSGFLFELNAEAIGTLAEARVDLLGLPDVDGMSDMIDDRRLVVGGCAECARYTRRPSSVIRD